MMKVDRGGWMVFLVPLLLMLIGIYLILGSHCVSSCSGVGNTTCDSAVCTGPTGGGLVLLAAVIATPIAFAYHRSRRFTPIPPL